MPDVTLFDYLNAARRGPEAVAALWPARAPLPAKLPTPKPKAAPPEVRQERLL